MVEVNKYIENKDAHMLLQVHDELVFEIQKGKEQEIVPKIKEIMETVLSKKETKGVPIVANAETGDNWGDMKEL